jgi:hypothetical protein
VQQWVKAWAADENPEVGVQVLDSHTDPQGHGVVIPIRLRRRGYQLMAAFPEESFAKSSLPETTSRTLGQIVRLLRYMEVRGLPRSRRTDLG